jgi:hypothetical protein
VLAGDVLVEAGTMKALVMLVDLARREGDMLVVERIEAPLDFEGSVAEEGVLVTFPLDGRDVTGRIIRAPVRSADMPDAEPVVEIELIDREALDAESSVTLTNLPPKGDLPTGI